MLPNRAPAVIGGLLITDAWRLITLQARAGRTANETKERYSAFLNDTPERHTAVTQTVMKCRRRAAACGLTDPAVSTTCALPASRGGNAGPAHGLVYTGIKGPLGTL